MLANIKSAIKRIKINEKKALRNRKVKSSVKTIVRAFDEDIASGNVEGAKKLYPRVSHVIDKATAKGIMHKNTAARKKSRLALKMNKATAQ